MSEIDILISIFEGELGYTEDPPGSNRTKYGEAYGWNGVPWCVQYQWWGFMTAKLQRLFYGGHKTASCGQLMKYAQKVGQWVTEGFRRGDLVIMDFPNNSTTTDHIGFVKAVKGPVLITLEGNTSSDDRGSQNNGGAVCLKERDIRKVKIVGAYRPKYSLEDDNMTGEEIYKKLNDYLKSQPVPEWAKAELQEAIDAGITDGSNPMALIPRYQAAIMAHRGSKI